MSIPVRYAIEFHERGLNGKTGEPVDIWWRLAKGGYAGRAPEYRYTTFNRAEAAAARMLKGQRWRVVVA